jgi:hypothetical protein
MVYRIVALLLLSNLSLSHAADPVTKVVELIEELKAKIIADGKAEQVVYDKFACWCELTSKEKATAIHEAHEDIKVLSTKILENKGLVATRTSEIAQLSIEIMKNQKVQDEATSIRQKENAEYMAEKTQFESTLSSLESGVKALTGAALLQGKPTDEFALLKLGQVVHQAIEQLPSGKSLPAEELKLIRMFAKDPAEFYDQKAAKAKANNPASSTITGILKDMYDTFSMNLEKATEVEAVAYKNYESITGVKVNEMADLVADRKKKDGEKADAEKIMADSAQELDDTKVTMKEDMELFDLIKAGCQAKNDEWMERVRARTEELAGIDKALEILTGDEAKALFGNTTKPDTFLQIDDDANNSPKSKAYKVLKKLATKTQSLRLAEMAANLRLGGHFDAVIVEIEKMMATLKQEEKDDIEQRDWCKEETFKNEQEASRYEYKIELVEAKTSKLQTRLFELESTLGETVTGMLNTKNEIATMEDTRKEEHATYTQGKADNEGAIKLLGMAMEAMSSYHKNTGLIQQTPEDRLKELGMPTETFTDAKKNAQESKGIVGIMEMIIEDLTEEIEKMTKEEIAAQTDYEEELGAAKKLLEELKVKKTDVETTIAETQKAVGEEDDEKEELVGLLKDEKDYLAGIKPDCDWILKAFDERRMKRAAELEGLMNAKGMLGGSSVSLSETEKTFDDDEFPKMRFSFLQRH